PARLDPPSLKTHGRQASRLFPVLAPRWWNELPLAVGTAESLAVFKRRLKTHFFVAHLNEYECWAGEILSNRTVSTVVSRSGKERLLNTINVK
ncbi:hypothetical protein NFI96_024377, partial [Prochilodus magdalenae]